MLRSVVGKNMQQPDGKHLPDIDDVPDGGVGSYNASTAATSISSAVADNAPKMFAAAFILLCFICFGPRGIAMALIVLAALRITLGPVSSATGINGNSAGALLLPCKSHSAGSTACASCVLCSLSCPTPPSPPPSFPSLLQAAAMQREAATSGPSATSPSRTREEVDEDREPRPLRNNYFAAPCLTMRCRNPC
jgi:hypothetical protein